MKYCANCGTQLEDSMKFCPACGAGCDDNSEQSAAAEPNLDPEKGYIKPELLEKEKQTTAILGILGLLIGILSLILSILAFFTFGWFLGELAGIAGIVLSALAISHSKRVRLHASGMGVAGLVLSILGVIISPIAGFTSCACLLAGL